MGTTGTFTFDLNNVADITNNTIGIGEKVTEGVNDYADLIGLAIAISIALVLIFGVVFLAWNFLVNMVGKAKGLKKV